MTNKQLNKELELFFENTKLGKSDYNIKQCEILYNCLKNSIMKEMFDSIEELKEEWDYEEPKNKI